VASRPGIVNPSNFATHDLDCWDVPYNYLFPFDENWNLKLENVGHAFIIPEGGSVTDMFNHVFDVTYTKTKSYRCSRSGFPKAVDSFSSVNLKPWRL
jgi:hypothetical protein